MATDGFAYPPENDLRHHERHRLNVDRTTATYTSWKEFENKYKPHLVGGNWPDIHITDDEWVKACRAVPTHTAGGADGWTATDIKSLPDSALKAVHHAINYMHHNNYTPQSWTILLGALIPKEDYNGQPKYLRIITLLSIWYRVWAKLQYKRAMIWLDGWAPPEVVGG